MSRAPACLTIGTPVDILEAAADLAPFMPDDLAEVVIEALDALAADPDLECEENEPEDGEETDTSALMDGVSGFGLGLLPVYEHCHCCGHAELAGYVAPIGALYEGANVEVAELSPIRFARAA